MTRAHRSPSVSSIPARTGIEAPRIAVDLLGGDGAPAVVVDGALRACGADPNLQLLLVGPQREADEVVVALDRAGDAAGRVTALVVESVAGVSDSPVRAARRETTVRTAVGALADGHVHAVVSAGVSGAVVAAAAHGLGRCPGVRRPALAVTIPSLAGPLILLDVGASVDATPLDLRWHAILGATYAEVVEEIAEPRVGLLSIGTEHGKGDRLRKAAAIALGGLRLPASATYVGLVEGHDVACGGPADVVVTEGFTGNVLLKGIEGAYALAAAGRPAPFGVPRAAALLGIEGTVVMCHGAATAADIAAGIALAARLYRREVSAALSRVARELPVEAHR